MTALVVAAWGATPLGQTASERIGQVTFATSCGAAVQKPFERGVALLHSFWYIEAAKAFTAVTQADPDCAIAYWGLAMSQWTQIWAPPQPAALKRGWDAVEKAKAASAKTPRERDFIAAAEAFFKDADKVDHRTRAQAYGRATEQMYASYPQDREVAIFYALALQATADPHDKTYANQRKSAELAEKVLAAKPNHPGAAHYIIHAYDYPPVGRQGLAAARRYAQFAPSVPPPAPATPLRRAPRRRSSGIFARRSSRIRTRTGPSKSRSSDAPRPRGRRGPKARPTTRWR